MNHLEKKWKKLDNSKGGEDTTKAGKRADLTIDSEVCLWTLDLSWRPYVFVGKAQYLLYMPLITSPEKLE